MPRDIAACPNDFLSVVNRARMGFQLDQQLAREHALVARKENEHLFFLDEVTPGCDEWHDMHIPVHMQALHENFKQDSASDNYVRKLVTHLDAHWGWIWMREAIPRGLHLSQLITDARRFFASGAEKIEVQTRRYLECVKHIEELNRSDW